MEILSTYIIEGETEFSAPPMAVKLSSLTLSRRIPKWVSLKAHLSSSSSSSCAIKLQPTQEPDPTQSNATEFEAKIQFLKNKLHPDSLVSVLDTTPDLNSSIKLFKWASLQKRFNHTSETYQMMILKLGMSGRVEEMEGFCYEMVRDKCRDFDKSLLSLIDSFVSNHRLSEASRVLYVMNSSSVKPSIGTFNELMSALVEGKRDFKDVLFVYKEMVKSGIVPNIDTLNYLMEALFESGRVDLAMDQYKRMGKKGCVPNMLTFQIVISGLAVTNRVEESVIILQEMFECECELDSSFYNCIIPIFCSLKNLEIGLRLFKMMKASGLAPGFVIYGATIRCLCEFYHLDDAIELFREMVDNGLSPDHQLCLDIVNSLCKSNRLCEAENLLEERNIMDTCPRNAILESYCDDGNFSRAKFLFDRMFERDITNARSWNIIIRFLCENVLMNKASEYLCRMVLSSFIPNSVTYSALIIGNCRTGEIARALDLFSHVRLKSWVLDNVSYGEFVECLCEKGKIQEAIEVFCYMGTVSLSSTYNSILRGLNQSGRENELFVVLSRMIVSGCAFDVKTYCVLIQCMSDLSRKGECVSIFNLMLRNGLVPDSETLACLLSCLAKYSELHLIFPKVDKLVSESELILDSAMYNLLVDGLWREGYKNEASRLLDLMLEKGWVPDASTHALLMGSIASNKVGGKKSEESFGGQDYVSCILEEGLGKT